MNKEIVSLLQRGYCLLTPTIRLSRYLNNKYAALQIESGKSTWESADILPWHAWLHRFWDDISMNSGDVPLRLNALQQQNIWLQLVQESDFAKLVLQYRSVALRAIQAWDLTHQWQIPLFPNDIHINHDVRAFQSWANAYQKICHKENWLDDARLPDLLIKRLTAGSRRIDTKLALVGHDDLHPQQQLLLEAITVAGGDVITLEMGKQNRQISGAGFLDTRDEINAAANWARQLIQSNQGAYVGIVVPNLQKLRTQLQDGFDDVLLSKEILEPAEAVIKPYSISLGQALNSYPIAGTAFSILSLIEQPLSIQGIGVVLRSSHLKEGHKERAKRAILDATLREYGEQTLSFKNLFFVARKYINEEQHCLTFLNCMEAWQKAIQELPNSQSAHEWARTFSELLSIFEWPGVRPLNSDEYQTMTAWQELMAQFVSLDVVSSSFSSGAALSLLRQLASGFSFQPETAEGPIQIMGHAGAAGMHFDHLWILGLDEEAWPVATEPNPFIPIELQRRYQLPVATAENRLAYCRHLTERLIHSSADVVVSYPLHDSERPLRPSPLIKSYLKASDNVRIERIPVYSKLIFDSHRFEYKDDENAPPIPTGQHVSGGTGLFKDQAACAFRAFARHRLHARGLIKTDIGLNAMERGSLLHDVMQYFWQKINNHSALVALTEEQQDALIGDTINTAIMAYEKQRPRTFTDRFTALEKQRLKLLVREWLAIEKQRHNFRVVACEESHNFNFADIEVHTRIDRIDEMDDGRFVIVDYKTGDVSISAWFDERPDDPQLPLYAITSDDNIAALVFAKVRQGESRFIGVSDGEGILPAVKSFVKTKYTNNLENWDDLLADWKRVLLHLGNEFRQGKAEVNPKNETTCRYCDLHALCRIHELTHTGTDDVSSLA